MISPTGKKSPGKGFQKVRSKVAGNLKSQQRAKMTRAIVEASKRQTEDMLAGRYDVRRESGDDSPGMNGASSNSPSRVVVPRLNGLDQISQKQSPKKKEKN